jgi:hypothetical protein
VQPLYLPMIDLSIIGSSVVPTKCNFKLPSLGLRDKALIALIV